MEILKTKFGDVQLKRYASSRRIKLRILNKNTIQVTAPYAASQKAIHLFIAKNEHWIQQKINLLTQQMLISEGTNLALLDTLIEIDHQQKRDTSLFIPMDSQSSIEEQQDQIKHQINKIIRTTAKAYLPSRCLQ